MLALSRLVQVAAATVVMWLAAGAQAQAPDDRVAALLESLRARGAFSAEFVEEKQLAVLAAPLRSRGRVEFVPPARLRWEVREPVASVLVVDGDQVEISQPGEPARRIDLTAEPGVRSLVESFAFLLAGNLGALRSAYEVTFSENATTWRVSLVPRAAALRRLVDVIEVAGTSVVPQELGLRYANGDRSRASFEAVR